MRYLSLLLVLLAACKSENQRRREINRCIYANTDEQKGYTYALGVKDCLETNYDWSATDAERVQVQIDQAERDERRHQDSVRRAKPSSRPHRR